MFRSCFSFRDSLIHMSFDSILYKRWSPGLTNCFICPVSGKTCFQVVVWANTWETNYFDCLKSTTRTKDKSRKLFWPKSRALITFLWRSDIWALNHERLSTLLFTDVNCEALLRMICVWDGEHDLSTLHLLSARDRHCFGFVRLLQHLWDRRWPKLSIVEVQDVHF